MLLRLLVCNGDPVLSCQLDVCKAITMAGLPVAALSGCDRMESLPKIPSGSEQSRSLAHKGRLKLLKHAFGDEKQHSVDEVGYYIASLELLYTCSLGAVKAVERVSTPPCHKSWTSESSLGGRLFCVVGPFFRT